MTLISSGDVAVWEGAGALSTRTVTGFGGPATQGQSLYPQDATSLGSLRQGHVHSGRPSSSALWSLREALGVEPNLTLLPMTPLCVGLVCAFEPSHW